MSYQYLSLVNDVLENGHRVENRTGVDTISVFGRDVRYDLQKGFPLLTTKKTWFKGAVVELIWMLSGSTKLDFLHEHGVHFWDQWADENNSIGPMYGYLWRSFPAKFSYVSGGYYPDNGKDHVDQIARLVDELKVNPLSRRHVVTAWHPDVQPNTKFDPVENVRRGNPALSSCHWNFEVNCQPYKDSYKINLHAHLRSNDLPAGHPINVAFYALLTHMLAVETGYEVGELWITMTDAHIYVDQIEGIREQLTRTPHNFPKLVINRKAANIFDWKVEDFSVEDYEHHPAIKFPVAR